MNREKEIKKEIEKLQAEKQGLKSRRMITCLEPDCGKRTALKNALVVRTHWYTEPHGCTGGDYWNFGEYVFMCGKCCKPTRAYIGSWEKHWRSKEIKKSALKEPRVKLFKFIEKHREFVGEFLDAYGDKDERMTVGELREKNKERARRR